MVAYYRNPGLLAGYLAATSAATDGEISGGFIGAAGAQCEIADQFYCRSLCRRCVTLRWLQGGECRDACGVYLLIGQLHNRTRI